MSVVSSLKRPARPVLEDAGIPPLVEHNQSRSRCGVLRGLHYQLVQTQGKLVRCSRRSVFDVAVDVRLGSPSFGQWVGAILDDVTHHQLWVPAGFAHGFLVLSVRADFCYLCSDYYHPASEQGIVWNDPAVGILCPHLPVGVELQLSAKDLANPIHPLAQQNEDQLPVCMADHKPINTH